MNTPSARFALAARVLPGLLLLGAAVWAGEKPTQSHLASDGAFQVNVYEGQNRVRIEIQNLERFPITATLTLGEKENLSLSNPLPKTMVLAPKQRGDFVTLGPRDATQSWRYGKVRCSYLIGSTRVRPRPRDYELPFPVGKSYRVDQAFNGAFSHKGKNALDFALAEGDLVTAARGGLVVKVTDHNPKGGAEERFRGKANRVWIFHKDGTFGCYAHFRQRKIRVKLGERVRVGQVLGEAGQSGFAQGPHLHFEVRYAKAGRSQAATVPVTFRTSVGERQTLRAGKTYARPEEKR